MPDPDISGQIDQLIVETPDPKDKALLLILKKISDNLEDNTYLTRILASDLKAHTDAFEKHEKAEMALINQGRGFLRGAVIGLAFVQAIFGWYFQRHMDQNERVVQKVITLETFAAEHKVHHQMEEKIRAQ